MSKKHIEALKKLNVEDLTKKSVDLKEEIVLARRSVYMQEQQNHQQIKNLRRELARVNTLLSASKETK